MFFGSLVLISIASLIPLSGGDMLFPHQDKLQHALAYVYLYAIGWWALLAASANQRGYILVFGLVLYGIIIECLQGASGYRDMDSLDLLANISGIGLGLLLVRQVRDRVRISAV